MASGKRWQRLLAGGLILVLGGLGSARAAVHPTIHHAGVLRSVDSTSKTLVIDERVRLGPPLLVRIHVTEETVLVRVRSVDGEFRGDRLPWDQLKVGEYVVVRGIDRDGVHLAEMIWSLGPAQ